MISSAIRLVQYVGNDVATSFAINFVFHSQSHIQAFTTDDTGVSETLELGTDYTLDGVGNPVGGTLTTTSPLASTKTLTIARVVPYEQLTDYVNNDGFDSEAHERQMDLIVMMVQQLADPNQIAGLQALKFPITEPLAFNTTLPNANLRKDTVVYFNQETGEFEVATLAYLAQRLLVILGAEAVLPYRSVEVTGSEFIVRKEDVNTAFRVNSSTDMVVTLPTTEDFYDEFFCGFSRFGTGGVEFIGAVGVTIESDSGKTRIFGSKTEVLVQKIGVNRWWIRGDLY